MKRLLLQIFAWLAILAGAGLMLQPTVSQYPPQKHRRRGNLCAVCRRVRRRGR